MTEAGGCFATLDGTGSHHSPAVLLWGEPLLDPLLGLLRV